VRLSDHIHQCTAPLAVQQHNGSVWRLASARDYAPALAHCPTRYVLSDDVVRTCTALAYSGGDELAGCLDLIRIPSETLWVEWAEVPRLEELQRTRPDLAQPNDRSIARVGVLVHAHASGRTARMQTFWLTRDEPPVPMLAAVETLIDLDGRTPLADADELLDGRTVSVREPDGVALDRVMQCVGFRLEPSWQHYYAAVAPRSAARRQITAQLLAAVASDIPMLLSLYLLLVLRGSLSLASVSPARLNHKRARLGKRPLLDHIEVSSPLFSRPSERVVATTVSATRRSPRFHNVRGHIVRRGNIVYWRAPHWRGHMRLGAVATRTVSLHMHA